MWMSLLFSYSVIGSSITCQLNEIFKMEGQSNEILEKIFRQLEKNSDILEKCSKSCLKWNKIIENFISCPFDGCSVKFSKILWQDMEDHKMYCFFDPVFQKIFQEFHDGNLPLPCTLHESSEIGIPDQDVKKWQDSLHSDLRNHLVHKL